MTQTIIPKAAFGIILCYALFMGMIGCASFDRKFATHFEPTRIESGYQYFKYTSFADAVYPLDSDDAERTRISWLEAWLKTNGYNSAQYEVISRTPMMRFSGAFGTVYDIFYEIKTPNYNSP